MKNIYEFLYSKHTNHIHKAWKSIGNLDFKEPELKDTPSRLVTTSYPLTVNGETFYIEFKKYITGGFTNNVYILDKCTNTYIKQPWDHTDKYISKKDCLKLYDALQF